MNVPEQVYYPPFNITRASHTRLTVRDLSASKEFYTRVIGLVVTEEDKDTVYLRGVEEVCHHSLVLRRSAETSVCEWIGLRVLTEEELDKADHHFKSIGLKPEWVEMHGQGKTLRVVDPLGMPLELCARMTPVPRQVIAYEDHRGGVGLRFDHYQLHVTDCSKAWTFYSSLGFRTSDYRVANDDGRALAIFIHRKDIPWDFVIMENEGPRLHHFAFIAPTVQDMYRACDLAGQFGYGRRVERGPGSHPGGHGRFVYFRDPDGHRVELLLDPPHHMTDMENQPRLLKPMHMLDWGLPATRAWYTEATHFAGQETTMPSKPGQPLYLEDYLSLPRVAAE